MYKYIQGCTGLEDGIGICHAACHQFSPTNPSEWTPPQKYLGHKSIGIWRVDAPHHHHQRVWSWRVDIFWHLQKLKSAYVFDPEFVTAVLLRRTAVICVRSFRAAEQERDGFCRTHHMPITPIVRSEPSHKIAVDDNNEDKPKGRWVGAFLCRKPVDVPYHGFWNFGLHIASRACGPDEENMFHNFLQAFFVGTAK